MANTITIFRADPNSGMLTMLNTMSVPELQTEAEMLTSPDGKFLFVSTSTLQSARILVFNIGTLGSLTPVAGSPFLVSTQLGSMSTDAAGKFLFATQNNQVFGFVVGNDGSLTLTADSPFTVRAPFNNPDKGPVSVNAVLDPAAQFLFVGDSVNAVIHVYTVGLKGTLVEVSGSPFQSGIAGTAIATDPQGRFVFMGGGSAQLTALVVNRDTGVLTLAPGSPFDNGPFRSGGIPVFDAKVDPSGKFVLFADTEETKITVSAIDQTTGSLTNVAGSPFLTALRPIGGGSPSVITITH
jgi:6-phosphogluconolactonase (cycloisomerase 2 family)